MLWVLALQLFLLKDLEVETPVVTGTLSAMLALL